ncbi:Casein kinase II subunit beta, putative [Babesia ovata]|uniref:Casein kinase II subunit beta, putative n=1 Tax=Babesia ovata TaxID=189622 RepID=A0A2H6KC38_9APIC|nr:Casein kinase II subunit beta, putative [Babesia ovata]GBE60558.1 Casein kinase II subunit beta, putative [Babesia ovata]
MKTRKGKKGAKQTAPAKRARNADAEEEPVTCEPESVPPQEEAKSLFFPATAVKEDGSIKDGVQCIETAGVPPDDGVKKAGEDKILSHWLFADEGSAAIPPRRASLSTIRPGTTQSSKFGSFDQPKSDDTAERNDEATNEVRDASPTFSVPTTVTENKGSSGFTMASGKPCPTAKPEDIARIKSLLGLDASEPSATDASLPTQNASEIKQPDTASTEIAQINTMKDLSIRTRPKRPKTTLNEQTQRPNPTPAVAPHTDKLKEEMNPKVIKQSTDTLTRSSSIKRDAPCINTDFKSLLPPRTKSVSLLDMWCRNCVLTNHDGSSVSPAMLSRLWNIYGNPLTVTYSNSEKFTFIMYSPCDASITVGGLNEIQKCFKQMMDQCVEPSMERMRFDDEWLRGKYCLFTTAQCRKFRKSICRCMRKSGNLKDALRKVQLPNVLAVLTQIIKSFNKEYGGNESILMRILHGDAPTNSPVVIRVEDVYGDKVYITDGESVIAANAADCYVRQLLKTQRILPGSKLQLHGISIGTDTSRSEGSAVVQINLNAISPAPKKPLGLQNRHSNAHVRELKAGAGRVAQLDVTVLGVMPPVFKIFYKETGTNAAKVATLSEWDFNSLFADPVYKPPVTIESVYVHHTLAVIDTIILLRIKDYQQDPKRFEKALVKSCALLTLRNIDETIMGMIKPTTRLTLSSLTVKNSGEARRYNTLTESSAHIGNYLFFETSTQSRLDIKERDTPLQQIRKTVAEFQKGIKNGAASGADNDTGKGGAKSIFHTLILGEPALSISVHSEQEFFDTLQQGSEQTAKQSGELFIDQVCSLTGVVIEAGEIINMGRDTRAFRFFVLTTRFQLAVIKVSERAVLLPTHSGTHENACGKLDRIRRRLLSQRITVARAPEKPTRKKEALFIACLHLQYAGYDEAHKVYNFNTTSSRITIHDCAILQQLQTRLHNGLVFAEGTGFALSGNALKAAGDTQLERHCRLFAKSVAQTKLKVCHLLHTSAEDATVCEEMAAYGR